MRSATLRWIMVGCSVIIAFILLAQVYWLRRVYSLEEHHFKFRVLKSIRGLFNDLPADIQRKYVKEVVEIANPNTYLVQLNAIPPIDSLRRYLSIEFEDFDVWTDCNVAVYKASHRSFFYQYYLPAAAGKVDTSLKPKPPLLHRQHDYLQLHFPNRSKYIIQEMMFWIVTAILLTLVLFGLSVSMLYLYRQKFLNELQKDFVNNFSHEFKTPLAVMKIAGEVLTQPGIWEKPERLSKYAQVIKEQTEHLQQQVERLLQVAISEKRKLPLHKEACPLNQVIAGAIEQIEPLITNRLARVNFVPDENEPVIMADRAQLQLVIINLVENAIKYSIDKPHIIIELQDTQNGFYNIVVKDNGIGIEESNIKRLFNKFYRVPTGNVHNVTGFGLGLSFVKKVTDAHEGKIIVNSVVGIGSEFKIQLPKK